MSIGIRKFIDQVNERLQSYLITVDEKIDIPEDKVECKTLINALPYNQRYLEQAIERLENYTRDWCQLMKELSATKLGTEEKLYEEYTIEDPSNFLTSSDKAKVSLGNSDIRIKQSTARVRDETSSLISLCDQTSKIALPQLNLPSYNGDPKRWMELWERFSSAIDTVNIPTVQKFSYLLSCLQRSA